MEQLLVGNKADLVSRRVVDHEEGQELARTLGLDFIETSAMDATNVDQAFTLMAKKIKAKGGKGIQRPSPAPVQKQGGCDC